MSGQAVTLKNMEQVQPCAGDTANTDVWMWVADGAQHCEVMTQRMN